MALTQTERGIITNIIARLKRERLGCAEPFPDATAAKEQQAPGYEGVSRLYVNTWLIGPLELMLSDEPNDKRAALSMSKV